MEYKTPCFWYFFVKIKTVSESLLSLNKLNISNDMEDPGEEVLLGSNINSYFCILE